MKNRLFVLLLFIGVLASLSYVQFDLLKGVFPSLSKTNITITIADSSIEDPLVKPLLGVISGPDPSGSEASVSGVDLKGFKNPGTTESQGLDLTVQYQDIGVTSVRNNDYFDDRLDMELMFNCEGDTYPSWEGCDPADPTNYNWTISDAQFQSYMDGGFEPLFRLGGEWANSVETHDFKGPQNAVQEQNWIEAAIVVTDRYLHWQGQDMTFQYVDIWTEFPGTEHFWDRSNEEFINFWLNAYVQLEAAFPELKWGGVGFAASASTDVVSGEGGVAKDFLLEAYQRQVKPDWLGFHFFSNGASKTGDIAQSYRDLLNAEGAYAGIGLPWETDQFFKGVELIVDAYGMSKYENFVELSEEDQSVLYNGPKGASILSAHWIELQYSDVEGAYYYRGSPLGDEGEETTGSGLFYGDGSYKRISYAFKLWSKVVSAYPTLFQVELSTENQLFVLAAGNDKGERVLLVSNPGEEELTWELSDATEGFTYYQIDEVNTGEEVLQVTSTVMTIPAHSVQLVQLSAPQTGGDGGDGDDDDTTATVPDAADDDNDDDTTTTVPVVADDDNDDDTTATVPAVDSEPEPETCDENTFTDIAGHWGEDYIEELFCQGAVSGKTTGTFGPDLFATRAEILKVAYLAAGLEISENSSDPFTDVTSKDWFQDLVASAFMEGYVEGYSDGTFRPNDYVNRAEALTLFMRVFEEEPTTVGTLQFSDVKNSDWFAPSVSKAAEEGVVEGYSNNTYRPSYYITRAEVTALAIRMQEAY